MSRLATITLFLVLLIMASLGYLVWTSSRQASVLVEWSTATEMDTAGFNLYRSDNPDGPFVKINPSVIPASSNPLTGSAYSYQDKGVLPGRTYYYELEEIDARGSLSRFGPISVQARAGLPSWIVPLLGCGMLGLLAVWMLNIRRHAKKQLNPGSLT